ncbi:MAG: PIN domain-containing protein [Patescibacteria group bacterium]|jgi:rRNA maturation endonuclease Nob1|nr:PIN domain-containing protein [Patescibacteria group bacterium]
MIVVDSNILLRSYGFVEVLGREKGVQIIVPRAVVEELKYRADLDVLKRLRTKPQNGRVKKLEKTIALSLKRWPQVEEKIRSGEWKVAGSYRKRIVPRLIAEAERMRLKDISIIDIRVVATALALQNGGEQKVKLLSLDHAVIALARKLDISVPPTHGWQRHFWKGEILK